MLTDVSTLLECFLIQVLRFFFAGVIHSIDHGAFDSGQTEPWAASDKSAPGPIQVAASTARHQCMCGRSTDRPADRQRVHRRPYQRHRGRGPTTAPSTAATATTAAAAAAAASTARQKIQSAATHQMHFRAAGRW